MSEPYTTLFYRRVLARGETHLAQVWFDASVLDRYRGSADFSVIRTDTVGRVSRPRVWALDFGIAEGDSLIHASLGDLSQKLPEGEREHWAQHVVTPLVSSNFLRMQMAPGSCLDDGDVRQW